MATSADVFVQHAGHSRPRRKRFTIPHGLNNLLEEMSREILRYNPGNIPLYLAEYLEAKLSQQNSNNLQNAKDDTRTGKKDDFLLQIQDAKDGKPIPSSADEKRVALKQAYRSDYGKNQDPNYPRNSGFPDQGQKRGTQGSGQGSKGPSYPGYPGALQGQGYSDLVGVHNSGPGSNYYAGISGAVVGIPGIAISGRGNQSQNRAKQSYGGRKGASGPFGAYDVLAAKSVDVILGTLPEQVNNLVQEAAAAVDYTKDIDSRVAGPELLTRDEGRKLAQLDSARTNATGNGVNGSRNYGPGSNPPGNQNQRGQIRTSLVERINVRDSVQVLNKALDLVDVLQDMEDCTNSSDEYGYQSGLPSNRHGPEDSTNAARFERQGLGGVGSNFNTGGPMQGQRPNSRGVGPAGPIVAVPGSPPGGAGSQSGVHPYNPKDVQSSEALLYHIANAANSDLSDFPIDTSLSTTIAEMIRSAIENMLQRLILVLSGGNATTTTDTDNINNQIYDCNLPEAERRDLFNEYSESNGISRMPSIVASTRLNPVNFMPHPPNATESEAVSGGYPNFEPGSDIALAGSSVEHVYQRGPNSNYPSNSAFQNPNNVRMHSGASRIPPMEASANNASLNGIPLKGLAAWMLSNNVTQMDNMNLGQYVESVVQRASNLVDLSKKSYDANPEARKNTYYVMPRRRIVSGGSAGQGIDETPVTAIDLLNTTTELLETIETSTLDPITGLPDQNFMGLIKVTQQMLGVLHIYIQQGQQDGENSLALEALKMGAESLEIALILLKDSMRPRKEGVNKAAIGNQNQPIGSNSNSPISTKYPDDGVYPVAKGTIQNKKDSYGTASTVVKSASGMPLKLSGSGKRLIGYGGEEIPLCRTKSGHFITPNGIGVDFAPNGKIIMPDVNTKSSPGQLNKSPVDQNVPPLTTQSAPTLSKNTAAINSRKADALSGNSKSTAGLSSATGQASNVPRPPAGSAPPASAIALGMEGADGDVNNLLFPESRMEFNPGMGEWVEAVRNFMTNQIHIIRQLLSGEIPLAEARGQIVFLSVAFVVGIVVGFGVARSLGLFNGSTRDPTFVQASILPIPLFSEETITQVLVDLGIYHSE